MSGFLPRMYSSLQRLFPNTDLSLASHLERFKPFVEGYTPSLRTYVAPSRRIRQVTPETEFHPLAKSPGPYYFKKSRPPTLVN